MPRHVRLCVAALAVSSVAWAGNDRPVQLGGTPPATASSLVQQVDRGVAINKREIKQLKDDMAQQESSSQQAAERLRQQDQTIAELQRQLRELGGAPATAGSR